MKPAYHLTAIFIVAVISLAGCSRHYGLTSQELESQIARELPEGADAANVSAFLDRNRIEHTPAVEMPAELRAEPRMDSFFNDPKLEGKRERVRRVIRAKVPGVQYGFLTSFDIFAAFYLDSDDRLVGSVVKTIGTGP